MWESRKDFYKRILPPLKTKCKNNFKIFAFDVETEHIKNDFKRKTGKNVTCHTQEFIMGSVIGEGEKPYIFWDRKKMGDYLLGRKFRGGIILATNLEFDFNMIYWDRYSEFRKPIYRNGLLGMTRTEIDNKNEKGKRRVRKWTFLDTSNFIKTSLKNLGRIVDVDKLPSPPTMQKNITGLGMNARRPVNDYERKELTKYNVNDSLITYRFGEMFKDFCTKHNMNMKMTIGSTGMDFWRRNYQEYPMKREKDDICKLHFEGSFRGGMTQVFKRGTYNEKMWYYDYNSSYPARMRDGVDGKGSYPDPSSSQYLDKSRVEDIIKYDGICECKVKAPYYDVPMLGYKDKESKLIFGWGTFSGWFTNYELREAMKKGYEVKPKRMIIYKNYFKPFRKAVLYLYDLRKKYKEDNHPFQAMVKTLMNSGLFGKWGTNFLEMEDLISLDKITYDKAGNALFEGKIIEGYHVNETKDLFQGFISIRKSCPPFRYSVPILSSYTTMLGRMKLISDIEKHYKYLAYSDTDSAILTKPVFGTSKDLGDWDLEYVLDGGTFIKPKFYSIWGKNINYIKCKGVGKFINQDNFLDIVKNGLVDIERFTKMRESNRIGIRSGSIILMSKLLNMEDNKRLWEKKFKLNDWQDSNPHKLTNGEVL